jgi:hypothetical protein
MCDELHVCFYNGTSEEILNTLIWNTNKFSIIEVLIHNPPIFYVLHLPKFAMQYGAKQKDVERWYEKTTAIHKHYKWNGTQTDTLFLTFHS